MAKQAGRLRKLLRRVLRFKGLRKLPQNPPQQLAKASRLLLPWYLPRPHKLFLLGFETATWHVLDTP